MNNYTVNIDIKTNYIQIGERESGIIYRYKYRWNRYINIEVYKSEESTNQWGPVALHGRLTPYALSD
jgi:hypothetical protein